MINRNYEYKFNLIEVLFKCNRDNISNCPFGSIFNSMGKECKYLSNSFYCDNKFIHALEEGNVHNKLSAYIMHDTLDMIDTIQKDTKELYKG